ncbi:glycosyltransferase family 4 protein [Caldilinea aerophila]|jgi:glycosyltransferase involved in cell wall biosynthesis|uniref:Putative glycosyltransferase n=1 Tax=Caldilinea aerophila (strain DSM 14535 / JCM 11387 / NBRC 104270 / STL-6-O1) TaxID=926550 RepID=I0I6E2_CALAS|nr:glycosyltransferase family 4 protein [Caldilinea aerophila]BAM00830.1 putative glycosyltransferase [Caldilinea aerophila DSM 14535 = NBRC 104270]
MNILFVVPYAPNPVRVRPYEFIRTLVRRGHQVTVATLWTSEQERSDLEQLTAAGARVIAEPMHAVHSLLNSARALLGPTPLQASYSWNPRLMTHIREALQKLHVDAVHVEHLRGSRYAVGVRTFLNNAVLPARPPIIWDSVDSISYLFEQAVQTSRTLRSRLITGIELERTRRHEAWLVGQFERTLVTSALDRAAFVGLLNEYLPEALPALAERIEVIPNGVDLERFAFRDPLERPPATIIFSGKMSYHANVTAALHLVNDVMPLVWAQRPDVQVWIVGRDPTAEVRKLAEGHPPLPSGQPRVVVTGAVPNMAEYIQAATIAVAPLLYGAGIQNKALEALACGTPVVATHQATAALNVVSGRELLIADGAEAFAQALLTLLADPALRARLGTAGRRFVEEHHSWDAAVARLEAIYQTPPLQQSVA